LSSGGSFYYHAELRASGVAPPLGPERGGTRVSVLGAGFKDAYTLRCRFDNASSAVLARYVDASQLECASPIHSLGPKAVRLSMNAQQYASSSSSSSSGVAGGAVRYTYLASASVSALSPSRALAEGGTPVTVHGGGFSSSSEALGYLLCRLGGAVRRARWAGAGALVCNSTRGRAGAVRVEVSNNAREYTSDAARLQLVTVRVVDVQPWSGPQLGGTVVRVRGVGALPGGLRCGFGEGASSAAWSGGASALRCSASASAVSGWVGVQLSSFYGGLSSGGSFYYHAELRASGAAPPLGPERGGTRVSVLGARFRDAYTLRCRFDNASSAVLARYVDEEQLECVTPLHSLGAK
ncbi:MAG: IPT/TIG domain-containing protein, partial [Pseudomonadota bacterium]|nr:IPT/TIG domain-containing protein [Pseudomonadota bacterium]